MIIEIEKVNADDETLLIESKAIVSISIILIKTDNRGLSYIPHYETRIELNNANIYTVTISKNKLNDIKRIWSN